MRWIECSESLEVAENGVLGGVLKIINRSLATSVGYPPVNAKVKNSITAILVMARGVVARDRQVLNPLYTIR